MMRAWPLILFLMASQAQAAGRIPIAYLSMDGGKGFGSCHDGIDCPADVAAAEASGRYGFYALAALGVFGIIAVPTLISSAVRRTGSGRCGGFIKA